MSAAQLKLAFLIVITSFKFCVIRTAICSTLGCQFLNVLHLRYNETQFNVLVDYLLKLSYSCMFSSDCVTEKWTNKATFYVLRELWSLL